MVQPQVVLQFMRTIYVLYIMHVAYAMRLLCVMHAMTITAIYMRDQAEVNILE